MVLTLQFVPSPSIRSRQSVLPSHGRFLTPDVSLCGGHFLLFLTNYRLVSSFALTCFRLPVDCVKLSPWHDVFCIPNCVCFLFLHSCVFDPLIRFYTSKWPILKVSANSNLTKCEHHRCRVQSVIMDLVASSHMVSVGLCLVLLRASLHLWGLMSSPQQVCFRSWITYNDIENIIKTYFSLFMVYCYTIDGWTFKLLFTKDKAWISDKYLLRSGHYEEPCCKRNYKISLWSTVSMWTSQNNESLKERRKTKKKLLNIPVIFEACNMSHYL